MIDVIDPELFGNIVVKISFFKKLGEIFGLSEEKLWLCKRNCFRIIYQFQDMYAKVSQKFVLCIYTNKIFINNRFGSSMQIPEIFLINSFRMMSDIWLILLIKIIVEISFVSNIQSALQWHFLKRRSYGYFLKEFDGLIPKFINIQGAQSKFLEMNAGHPNDV